MGKSTRRLFARQAWIQGGWAADVLLVEEGGTWTEVRPGCPAADRGIVEVLPGPVLPTLVNAHSHAFQRAIAGLTERSPPGERDDFWSWRDRMYQVALAITPKDLERIATRLYRELVASGYSHVCEFHYLHNDLDGKPYLDAGEMGWALVNAAETAGIGLTLLPTLYMRSGFGASGLRDDQRRFASTVESVLRMAESFNRQKEGAAPLNAGIALHSIRAVDEGALREAAQAAKKAGWPVHIHISEQQLEVDDCVKLHGKRPVEWLAQAVGLDARWNLVHATRTNPQELRAVQESGASIVLCPTTEANLGDGVFDLGNWLKLGGSWSIGSDSHVCRDWREELRLLEYSQRLARRERNVSARAAGAESTAAVLFEGALQGGLAATGAKSCGFTIGARAIWQVLKAEEPLVPAPGYELDVAIFSR